MSELNVMETCWELMSLQDSITHWERREAAAEDCTIAFEIDHLHARRSSVIRMIEAEVDRLRAENGDLREQLANAQGQLRNGHKALTAAGVPEADDSGTLSVTGRVMQLRQQLATAQARERELWQLAEQLTTHFSFDSGMLCSLCGGEIEEPPDITHYPTCIFGKQPDHAALNAALAAARREGLERAAKWCVDMANVLQERADDPAVSAWLSSEWHDRASALKQAANAIPALPLEEAIGEQT